MILLDEQFGALDGLQGQNAILFARSFSEE
jgi:hypothetical protein